MMETNNSSRIVRSRLTPQTSILYVTADATNTLTPDDIEIEKVGTKAFGLSCLPSAWTLPYIVISDQLIAQLRQSRICLHKSIIDNWSKHIIKAALKVGISLNDRIILRSSGQKEGIDERGQYYSKAGFMYDFISPLRFCINKIQDDINTKQHRIPFILQKHVTPISATGHLSNERHCFKELRDWLGVYEGPNDPEGKHFQINLRNWRAKIDLEKVEAEQLNCNLSAHVSEVLKYAATWGSDRKIRLHFEWVWDGRTIYIVQADEENEAIGIEPSKIKDLEKNLLPKFNPTYLSEINTEHASKYEKIRNAILYTEMGLLKTKLYILDDRKVIYEIAQGKVPKLLKADLKSLVNGSLVIRMDIATNDLDKRQLLPRTNEVRDLHQAINWLIAQSDEMLTKRKVADDVSFIFHNFVPAISSAFAYAAPGQRQVQIEALWGLPEGLYYNRHDKFLVDTKQANFEKIDNNELDKFNVKEKLHCKQFFVTPNSNGDWETKQVKPPFDWHNSLKLKGWTKRLAYESRRIAEKEKKSISIMWFVGVPFRLSPNRLIPWYHEPYNPQITNRAITHRTKTPFDKSLIIRTSNDVQELSKETELKSSHVRRIRIQPSDERLLRDKNTLRHIGELAKKIDAIILLEGGVLSHAYYQLMKTNAVVEVKHPFSDFEETITFNKLVRDRVPENIEGGGEIVKKGRVSGEAFIRSLKEKLIEETFEVLDAVDQESIIAELADVNEVIDGILAQLKVGREQLQIQQDSKKARAGGFKSGIVLLKTENPLPTKIEERDTLFNNFDPAIGSGASESDVLKALMDSRSISKWSDRRRHQAASETVLRYLVPVTLDDWTDKSPQIKIDIGGGGSIRAEITGKRKGSNTQIEISFYIPYQQLKMF